MKPALPGTGTATGIGGAARSHVRLALIAIAVVLVVAALIRVFGHGNTYERIAGEMTAALQHNDLAAVLKFQNAETATTVNRERVGRAADALAPLGGLKSVKQTQVDTDNRVYDFDLRFEHGSVHETIKFDPDAKVVRFRYDPPTRS